MKCGNTLVGADVETVQGELKADLFGNRFAGMLQATELMREVGELTDATISEVEESESKYDHASKAIAPFKGLLDVWQAGPFGPVDTRRMLRDPQLSVEIDAYLRGTSRQRKTGNVLESILQTSTAHRFFHWELEFPEVWYGKGSRLDQPGFDAVIGNPPWVRQETLIGLKKILEDAFPEVYRGVADIYTYVLARGLEVLKPGGRLGFILPNKWLRANYGEPLRKLLASKYQPELLVDFGHAPLFPDADTFPVVAVIRRPHPSDGEQAGTLRVCPVPREVLDDLKMTPFVEKHSFGVPTLLLKPEGWALEPPEVLRLFEKIKNSGQPLKEVAGSAPLYGVKTGLNEAFFIDQTTRDRLVAADPKCERLIKKLLRGRNIQRWAAEWDREWVIALVSSQNREWSWAAMTDKEVQAEKVFAKEYPSLHARFKPMEQALRKREDQGTFWWELRPCDYYEKFEKPKIVYQVIQYHSGFALDREGHYLNDKGFFVPSGDLYLLAALNSSLAWWFLWRYLPHMKDEALNPAAFLMDKFPVIQPSTDARGSIEERAIRLIELVKAFAEARATFLQRVTHETSIAKAPSSLETPWQLQPDGFLTELKKAGLKRATPATLQHLSQTFKREASALRANRTEALRLERELDDLILKAYKLTPDEIALLRQTAPPRSPLTVLENDLQPPASVGAKAFHGEL